MVSLLLQLSFSCLPHCSTAPGLPGTCCELCQGCFLDTQASGLTLSPCVALRG